MKIIIILLLSLIIPVNQSDIIYEPITSENVEWIELLHDIELDPRLNYSGYTFAGDHYFLIRAEEIIIVLDIAERELVAIFDKHDSYIQEITTYGNIIASKSDNTIYLWDVSTGDILATFEGEKVRINNLSFSPDGQWFAFIHASLPSDASEGNLISLVDIQTMTIAYTWEYPKVVSLAFSPDSQILATGESRVLYFIDIEQNESESFEIPDGYTPYDLVYNSDGTYLLLSSISTVLVWSIEQQAYVAERNIDLSRALPYMDVYFTDSNPARLYDVTVQDYLPLWDNGINPNPVQFLSSNIMLSSVNGEDEFIIWDTHSNNKLKVLEVNADFGIISPDERFIATWSINDELQLWGIPCEENCND